MARRERGRPAGYLMSEESKALVSRARRLQATGAKAVPGFPLDMSYEEAKAVYERDMERCRLCHEWHLKYVLISRPGEKKKYAKRVNTSQRMQVVALPGGAALVCGFCRENNLLSGTVYEELPPPWRPT